MRPYRAIPIGKPIKSENFVYGWYSEIEGIHYITIKEAVGHWSEDFYSIIGMVEVIPETVSQQVGFKDKNSKEIYAGDKYKWYQPLIENGKQIRKEHISIVMNDIDQLYYLHNRAENGWGGVEIIGNIHSEAKT
ncbi:hypothetical protein LCGC14_1773170 [marine sediment metagenome]|uniref:YopX protein domain-containing protein n=1 Tax=marine sediment metagenome TaxID=412755 RepID=A0A0F9JXB6_9ZZZZ